MPRSHRVLYLHPLAIFKTPAQVTVILDMDAYMYMRQPWSGTLALCSVGVHNHVGHTACWDGTLRGLSTMCTQISSCQVRIAWYPTSLQPDVGSTDLVLPLIYRQL